MEEAHRLTLKCETPPAQRGHMSDQASVGKAGSCRPLAGTIVYFRLPSIQSTVAWICSSVSAGLPPLGGMMPPSGPV